MAKFPSVTPGELLLKEFLDPVGDGVRLHCPRLTLPQARHDVEPVLFG